jgi:hypothetical protein
MRHSLGLLVLPLLLQLLLQHGSGEGVKLPKRVVVAVIVYAGQL